MEIKRTRIVVLDNSTLGKLCKDAFDNSQLLRRKAITFVQTATGQGISIGLTATSLMEYFAHEDDLVFAKRYAFLNQLPSLAWIEPYDGSPWVGDFTNVLTYELHDLFHGRPDGNNDLQQRIWRFGKGNDMFPWELRESAWKHFRVYATQLQRRQSYVSSIIRSEPTGIEKMKLSELVHAPKRSKNEQIKVMNGMIRTRARAIAKHGDEKLRGHELAASQEFYGSTLQLLGELSADDLIGSTCSRYNIPRSMVRLSMTVEQFTELVSLSLQLASFGRRLSPPVNACLENVDLARLQTLNFDRKLSAQQKKAERMRGSDAADARQASIALYAHRVEVDKRTYNFVGQLARKCQLCSTVYSRLLKSTDYSRLADEFSSIV